MTDFYSALSGMVYYAMMNANRRTIQGDDSLLRMRGVYDPWSLRNYVVGEICNAVDQTWECYQAFDAAAYPQVTPENPAFRTFFRPLHGKSVATAQPFVQPQGAYDMYHTGEYIWFRERIYLCKTDTAYSPEDYKAAWEVLGSH